MSGEIELAGPAVPMNSRPLVDTTAMNCTGNAEVLPTTYDTLSEGTPLARGAVPRLYRDRLDTEWLDLSRSVIEEKETKLLARALESNKLKKLKVLFLHGNAGDLGTRAMLNSLHAGHLVGLQKLILWEVSSYDQITTAEEGTDIIADSIGAGRLPNLQTLDLTGSLPKLVPPRGFYDALKDLLWCSCGRGRLLECCQICLGCLWCSTQKGTSQTLDCLRCQFCKLNVYSGDDGIRKIGRGIRQNHTKGLRFLILQDNYIRTKGALDLAKILRRGTLPHLEEVDLQNNPVGWKGAQAIVHAFLKNPLLTARVKLDWPSLLLKERAIAFRESNIRLEHRLEDLHIQREKIVVNNYNYPSYCLRRPQKGTWVRDDYRLHLLCQANYQTYGSISDGFEDHEVLTETPKPEGIEIRRRPLFGGELSQKFVDRDLEPVTSSSSESDDDPGLKDPQNGPQTSLRASSSTEDIQADLRATSSLFRQETSLKRQRGVNRIYITYGSCGFIGAAKALGSQSGQQSRGRTWYSNVRKHFQTSKMEQHMTTIKEELLMLAERKPDEFFCIFGLRHVLLKNPKKGFKYSVVWICNRCFEKYGDAAKPITRDSELVSRTPVEAKRKVPGGPEPPGQNKV